MRANPFESQLERLARTLTEQFGVRVVCQGDNAWTDGRQIVLPSLPDPLNNGLERMMVGYLDHEMAHVAFSDFQIAGEFAKKHPGHEAMLNVVEDALIERRAMDRWPGVRANLDAMFAQIQDRVATLITQRGPFDRFCTAVYLKLSHHNDLMGLDHELSGYEDLLDRYAAIQSTPEAASLAESLLERWLKQPPQKAMARNNAGDSSGSQSQPTQGNPAQSQESDQESSSSRRPGGSAGGNRMPETDADASNSNDAENKVGTPSSKSGKMRRCKSAAESAEKQADTPVSQQGISSNGGTLISQAIADAIAECVAHTSNLTEYRAFTKQHDKIAPVAAADDSAVKILLSTGVDVVRRLRRGLANALRSAEKRWWRDDQMRGSLSPRSLYRLCTEWTQLDVFRERTEMMLKMASTLTAEDIDVLRGYAVPAVDTSVIEADDDAVEGIEEAGSPEVDVAVMAETPVVPARPAETQPAFRRRHISSSAVTRGEYEQQRTRESKVSTVCVGREREKHDWWPVGTELVGHMGSQSFTALVVDNAQVKSGRSILITSGAASGKVCMTPTRAAIEATENYRMANNLGRGGGVTNGWEFWKART